MRKNPMLPKLSLVTLFFGFSAAGLARGNVYLGNGGAGFGGVVGLGSLSVTDDGAGNVTFSFNSSNGTLNGSSNDLVIYISTGASGLSDTSTLVDNGDGGREAISGYNGDNMDPSAGGSSTNPVATRTLVTFPTGFQADYALSIQDASANLFQLPLPGTVDYLTYTTGVNSGTTPAYTPYTITVPLSDLGLTQGESFEFVGTLDTELAYRSNEAIGATDPDISLESNPGYTGTVNFSAADEYTTTAVPEPAGLGLLGMLGFGLIRRRRGNT